MCRPEMLTARRIREVVGSSRQSRQDADRFLQHPRLEVDDDTGALGDGDEVVGADLAEAGAVPTQQDFGADRHAGVDVDDGLQAQRELPLDESVPHGERHLCSFLDDLGEPLVEQLDAAAAAFLGVVHRGVGLGDAVERVAMAVDDGDTGARRQREQLTAAAGARCRHDADEATGVLDDEFQGGRLLEHHDELVAADSSHQIVRAGGTQPLAELGEDAVALAVALRVVHALEPVEIEEDDGARHTRSAGCRTR